MTPKFRDKSNGKQGKLILRSKEKEISIEAKTSKISNENLESFSTQEHDNQQDSGNINVN